jgi:hypothetical protein
MRLSDIAFGFIFILFISNFALAAPLPTRGKRDACVDVVPIPKDAMTVLGKRVDEDFEKFAKMVNEYFESWGKSVESSNAHVSSSSAPPASDHGPTANVKAPEPNPGSPLLPPGFELPLYSSIPSPTLHSMPGVYEYDMTESYHEQLHSTGSDKASPASSESDPDYVPESTPKSTPKNALRPKPNPGPPEGVGPDILQEYWKNLEDKPPPKPNPGPSEGVDPDIVWEYWKNLEDQPPPKRPKLASKIVLGHDREVDPQPSNPGLSSDLDLGQTDTIKFKELLQDAPNPNPRPLSPGKSSPPVPEGPSNTRLPTEPWSPEDTDPESGYEGDEDPDSDTDYDSDQKVARPPPSPESTHPELRSDNQPVDLLAAIYNAKGKAKESRRIPSTARDVGNATE